MSLHGDGMLLLDVVYELTGRNVRQVRPVTS